MTSNIELTLEDELKTMKLHDELFYGNFKVLRVIGGWIYTHKFKTFGEGVGTRWLATSTFVPENHE